MVLVPEMVITYVFFLFFKLHLAAVLVSGLTVLNNYLSDVYIFLYAGVIEMLGEFHCCERKLQFTFNLFSKP